MSEKSRALILRWCALGIFKRPIGVSLVALVLILAGCAGGGAQQSDQKREQTQDQKQEQMTVSIRDYFFDPANITVAPGTTVKWVNEGNATHTVTANDRSFDSGRLNPGQSFTHTFEGSGTFSYFCEIHPSMTASVSVNTSGGGQQQGQTQPQMQKQTQPQMQEQTQPQMQEQKQDSKMK